MHARHSNPLKCSSKSSSEESEESLIPHQRAKITRSPCFGRYSCAAIAADPTRAAATTASPYVGNESTTPVSPATGALPGTAWKINRDGL